MLVSRPVAPTPEVGFRGDRGCSGPSRHDAGVTPRRSRLNCCLRPPAKRSTPFSVSTGAALRDGCTSSRTRGSRALVGLRVHSEDLEGSAGSRDSLVLADSPVLGGFAGGLSGRLHDFAGAVLTTGVVGC
jgi:hypothetical protein